LRRRSSGKEPWARERHQRHLRHRGDAPHITKSLLRGQNPREGQQSGPASKNGNVDEQGVARRTKKTAAQDRLHQCRDKKEKEPFNQGRRNQTQLGRRKERKKGPVSQTAYMGDRITPASIGRRERVNSGGGALRMDQTDLGRGKIKKRKKSWKPGCCPSKLGGARKLEGTCAKKPLLPSRRTGVLKPILPHEWRKRMGQGNSICLET